MPNLVPSVSLPVRLSRKVTLDPANCSSAAHNAQTFTVTGLKTNHFVLVNAPNLETGVKIVAARCTAADTLELTFVNFSGGDVNPASQVFFVIAL